jgi:hypothetical protein
MRLGALLALLVWIVVFASGLAMVLRHFEDPFRTAVALGELGIGGLLVSLAVWVAMPGFRRWRREPLVALLGLLLGALLGAFGGLLFVLGVFLPYAAGWGGHELNDFGGEDFTWQEWLTMWLVSAAVMGAVVGAVCGLAAWVLRFAGLSRRTTRMLHRR